MATLLLSAAGAAIGGSIGGTVLGLSATVAERFVGATIGRAIDQRLLGQGSDPVETGRVERIRLTGAGEGDPVAQVHGRMRIGGHVIWASEFTEDVTTHGGGKGAPRQPEVKEYSYSVSLAIALCEGEITRVGRIWADGVEIGPAELTLRVYPGSHDQLPDPKMEAVEGAGQVPAYRGTAYVVFEDLDLGRFGNRVPQFSFEVVRPMPLNQPDAENAMPYGIHAVALMPGSGEYALAETPVYAETGPGQSVAVNVNSPHGLTDMATSVEAMVQELPNCEAVSLIVSWFGDDLRAGDCRIKPKVEFKETVVPDAPWVVAGLDRETAEAVAKVDDRPVYGGTPSDQSVIEAIRHLNAQGQAVLYYPFILMEQLAGNGLPDPYSDAPDQAPLPWRGRITTAKAPGQEGSSDGTAAAEAEVAAFFGTARASDFTVEDGEIVYDGPEEWRFRRYILHQAALCAAAGGVEAFCIGSEMRGLTQIRGAGNSFPAVTALRDLAAEVRALLGPETKISYAADWSEYFGYAPQDGSGDRFFHLDPLWADPNIDFIGIDNYMRLSDWRDGDDHADAAWGSIYDLDYLRSNILGGEGYDWYYHSPEAEAAQIRTPITDGAHHEPWVWRYKDIVNWWKNAHFERVGGVRAEDPTVWVPESKPIWFTEAGCAAIDKGTNQPNKFLDPKSSESRLPKYSNGMRDELIQHQYLQALHGFWREPENNPVSEVYGGPMLDMDRCFIWAWDLRPFPFFPGLGEVWSDGDNYARGHWINGRTGGRPLASVVAEICDRAGLRDYDVSALWGYVRGYTVADTGDARAALQPLMLRYGFDAVERDGLLRFINRDGDVDREIDPERIARHVELEGDVEYTRQSEAEMAGRVRLRFVQADGDFDPQAEEAISPRDETHAVAQSEVPLSLTRVEARQTVLRWLSEAQIARETVRFALPPSALDVGPGDVVRLPTAVGPQRYRVDRVEHGAEQLVEGVRIAPAPYAPAPMDEEPILLRGFDVPVPVLPLFLDLPLMRGDEVPHAPHIAVAADPWPGSVAVYDAPGDAGYVLNQVIAAGATVGVTENALFAALPGVIDRGPALQVRLGRGVLESVEDAAFLGGANLMAIGDGRPGGWELFQFRDAQMLTEDTWLLSHRLRGQLGTDAEMPQSWPVGSYVVLMNAVPQQIDLPAAQRGQVRHYRIGPALKPYDDPTYAHRVERFEGRGLRPLSPVHLRADQTPGRVDLTWIRRTRVDGDGWNLADVPLGEEREAYRVRVLQNGSVLREAEVTSPAWRYTLDMQAEDGALGGVTFEVAQLSARYGPGVAGHLTVIL